MEKSIEKKSADLLVRLERNNKGSVKMNDYNLTLIMNFIIENEISNVAHLFSKQLHLSLSSYYNGLKKFKLSNPSYYAYYEEKLKSYKERVHNNIITSLLYMGTLMKYGVELEDGSFREFDLFDWFVIKNKYFDNLNRRDISKILDLLSADFIIEELDIKFNNLRTLISKSYGDCSDTYSFFIDKAVILMDNYCGLTADERVELIEFMQNNNIPFNHDNYQFGIKRMMQKRVIANDSYPIGGISVGPINNKKR